MEIPRGKGVLKAKILKAKYKAKLEFLGGREVRTKNLPWEEYGYFLELHINRLKYFTVALLACFNGPKVMATQK